MDNVVARFCEMKPIPTECKYCQSKNLGITPAGPHQKLFCLDCGAYQKFIPKKQVEFLIKKGVSVSK